MPFHQTTKHDRRGLTLVEILIALTMTLIVLGAMMYAFRYASQEISQGRAMMELSNQLRTAQDLLRSDFDGITVDARPWSQTAGPNGYLEIVEGMRILNGAGAVVSGGTDDTTFINKFDTNGDGLVDLADTPVQGAMGDIDDIVAMTVRSREKPFRGRFDGTVIESNVAEVIWWTTFDDLDGNGRADYGDPISLHRRVLLIRPDLLETLSGSFSAPRTKLALQVDTPQELQEFFLVNDVSARPIDADGDGDFDTMVPNSLADLSKRENRFARVSMAPWGSVSGTYPFAMQAGVDINGDTVNDIGLLPFEMTLDNFTAVDAATATSRGGADSTLARFPNLTSKAGDDIVLSDVIGFDLQVFSPNTLINTETTDNNLITTPTDIGYDPNTLIGTTRVTTAPLDSGAFVDLAYARDPTTFGALAYDPTLPAFSTLPTDKSGLAYRTTSTITRTSAGDPTIAYSVYDTFSTHYESDGLPTDADALVDEGADGIDNDGINGVDDNGERETLPPYPERLLGVKVTVRIVDRNSKQIRQTEVVSSFVPQ